MKKVFALALLMIVGAVALPSGAAPTFSQWDGAEPATFTHEMDNDGDGACDGPVALDEGGVPNGRYPACARPDGSTQIPHGHFEYTHEQDDPARHDGETMEKDYADRDLTDPSDAPMAAEDFYWFAAAEPGRVGDAVPLTDASGPQCYWQVDEWIGPRAGATRAPITTWNERFWLCSDGAAMSGGYWTDQQLGAGCYEADGRRRTTCGGQGGLP